MVYVIFKFIIAKKGTRKGNIVSSGAMIANQQQPTSIHQPQALNQNRPNTNNNIPHYPMMMQQQPPNYYPIPIPYQQPYAPYSYNPYPPIINYPQPQMTYMPSYINPMQYQQQQTLIPSNKPININITNTLQQPTNRAHNENKEHIFQNDYKPYTLEDYKELSRVAVIMGNLGPNIGTKEWEEKKKKMKRITDYANKLNKEQKGISRIKTETPADEKEKERQIKIENSNRFKSFEYGKLVRPKGATSDQFYYKDIGIQTKNEQSNQILQDISQYKDKITFEPIIPQMSQGDNNNSFDNKQQIQNQSIDNTENKNNEQLDFLLKQRENYQNKIDAIKESLL